VPSARTVRRILAAIPLQPHRQKMWLTSHDDEFRAKRDDVLRTYYETPAAEHVICVDEKTQMQALERVCPDVAMAPGQPVRRSSEYTRHGTQVLMGAWDVRRGRLFGFVSDRRGTVEFLDLLDLIDACYPTGRGHIVCDNLSEHVSEDVEEWFAAHPRWTQHLTPKRASWLNQIEDAFSILQRRVLARGSFTSTQDLREKVERYLCWELTFDRPFDWMYRPDSWRRKSARTSGQRH
jgi:hypothetical protein